MYYPLIPQFDQYLWWLRFLLIFLLCMAVLTAAFFAIPKLWDMARYRRDYWWLGWEHELQTFAMRSFPLLVGGFLVATVLQDYRLLVGAIFAVTPTILYKLCTPPYRRPRRI